MKKILALILCLIMTASLFACDTETLIPPGECREHVFEAKVTTEDYLKSEATCKSPAVYYYCCIQCTQKGSETYEYGSPEPHSYEKRVLDKYKRTEANDTDAATYYYSCKCGDKSSSYFYYGDPLSGNTGNNVGNTGVGTWTSCDKTVYGLTKGMFYTDVNGVYVCGQFNISDAIHVVATNGEYYEASRDGYIDQKAYIKCDMVTDDIDTGTFINYPDDINTPDGSVKDTNKGMRLYTDITGSDASYVALVRYPGSGTIYPKAKNKKGDWVEIIFIGKDVDGVKYNSSRRYYVRADEIMVAEYDFVG